MGDFKNHCFHGKINKNILNMPRIIERINLHRYVLKMTQIPVKLNTSYENLFECFL